nr:MAG TPA: hypothetical protein [Caudoviricetes sp.]
MKVEVKLELEVSGNTAFPTVLEYLKFWYGCTNSYEIKNLADFNAHKDMKTTKCTIKQKGTKKIYTFEEYEVKEEAKQRPLTLKNFGFSNE